jgi:hypothetical protein
MECFLPQDYNFAGPDPKLDMVVALLAMGKNDYRIKVKSHGVSHGVLPAPVQYS